MTGGLYGNSQETERPLAETNTWETWPQDEAKMQSRAYQVINPAGPKLKRNNHILK